MKPFPPFPLAPSHCADLQSNNSPAWPGIRTVADLIHALSWCNPDHLVVINYETFAEARIKYVQVIPLGEPSGPYVKIVGEN